MYAIYLRNRLVSFSCSTTCHPQADAPVLMCEETAIQPITGQPQPSGDCIARA